MFALNPVGTKALPSGSIVISSTEHKSNRVFLSIHKLQNNPSCFHNLKNRMKAN
jgi:hypothetical protein